MEEGPVGDSAGEAAAAAEEAASQAARKRYEVLLTVRDKAITKGKGSWYWAHLEPVLVPPSAAAGDSSPTATAAKLRCSLCSAVFSASNPSRTASEHLKRGACPSFPSTSAQAGSSGGCAIGGPMPISSLPPASPLYRDRTLRKRSARFLASSPPQPKPPLVLSGGKADLDALAMLEDSVRKLRSPKTARPAALPEPYKDAALGLLADWLLESAGAVSPSVLCHQKLQSFLLQVGLPPVSPRQLTFPRLHSRYSDISTDVNDRIQAAAFFQLASDGWKSPAAASSSEHALVSIAVNLPDGTMVLHRLLLSTGYAPTHYAEEILMDAIGEICGGSGSHLVDRCAGIVADRFKSKALHRLEDQNHWMVNFCCQVQAFHSLIEDFACELPLYQKTLGNCSKLANFINNHSQVRIIFLKYRLEEHGHAQLLRCSRNGNIGKVKYSTIAQDMAMVTDIINSRHLIQMSFADEDYKLVCIEEPTARELAGMTQSFEFWNELEAVHSLVKLIKAMAREMELEQPLVAQCLPMWEELRSKVKDWSAKYGIDRVLAESVIDKRFDKNYHPAWPAAFVLDPVYLVKDSSGKYLPPFRCLTPEQEKDVDRLITRLVSRKEAHIVLMELMKWRSEGLDPLYAQAVQVKQQDPLTGKIRMANPQSRRLVWETCLGEEFKCLRKVAARLIFLHATSCRFSCNPTLMQWMNTHGQSRPGTERGIKVAFLAACSKIGRRDFRSDQAEEDMELFEDGGDDLLDDLMLN